jgi:two-component system sensor histidine kinase BaeS
MRSVVARLVVATLTVALLAVAATAWVASRETAREVRSAVERDLEVEDAVYEELSFYALTNGSWEGVATTVSELSADYDQRIALTTVDGEVIADSADLHGSPAPLPDAPVGYIAPDSPVISFDSPATVLDGLEPLIDEGMALAEALAEAGVAFSMPSHDFGIVYPEWSDTDPLAQAVVDHFFRKRIEARSLLEDIGLPPELVETLRDEALDLAGYLSELDVGFSIIDEGGLPVVEWDTRDPATKRAVGDFYSDRPEGPDLIDVLPVGIPEEAAEPALLFLGFPAEGVVAADPVGWRVVGAAALVALVAVAMTIVVGRRMLAPIGAITQAARRRSEGGRFEPVPVRGDDELAELAGAFNAMAASVEEQDRLRRAMAADVAHELRTPLSNIRGYLEALQEGVAEPTPEVLGSIHEEAMHLQHLVDDLQMLSLAEAGELRIDPQPADLGDVVAQAVGAHRPGAEAADVELEMHAAGSVPVDVDRARMRQVVANLVDNAIRHTPAGGVVSVTTRSEAGRALLQVADTGPGIPAEHRPHVFDRLYRADPSRSRDTGGSGLGLSIARELVRAHGGDLTVDERPGGGAVFTASLPLAPPAT